MKQIELEAVNKIYRDQLLIQVGTDWVTFRVRVDGSGNEFRISKQQLREFLWQQNKYQPKVK